MKKQTLMVIAAVGLLASGAASGQMMGGSGGHHGGGTTPPTSGSGMMPGTGAQGGMGGAMEMTIPVAQDGTAFVVAETSSNNSTTHELIAVRANGTIAWKYALRGAGMPLLRLAGDTLLIAAHGMMNGADSVAPALVGLSAASGTKQWELDLDGAAMSIETFSGGTYVIVGDGTDSNGMHDGNSEPTGRSLLAVSVDGRILWRLPLAD